MGTDIKTIFSIVVTQLVFLGRNYLWFKLCINASRHQVIAWNTNKQLSTMTCDRHLREICKHFSRYGPLNCDKKMFVLKLQSHLPRAYELIKRLCKYIHCDHNKPVSFYYRTRMSYKLLGNPRARLNIRKSSYQYRDSHCIDKSHDRLTFMRETPYKERSLYIETEPRVPELTVM